MIGSFCLALFLLIRHSLSVTFCSYKSILIFSMSNENIIIHTKITSNSSFARFKAN